MGHDPHQEFRNHPGTKLNTQKSCMPKTKSLFRCPTCGASTSVLRTRSATSTRLVRYRECTVDKKHRCVTREILVSDPETPERAIGTMRLQIALRHLASELGIDIESTPAI